MSRRIKKIPKPQNKINILTEDDIADWVEKNGGIVLTRKHKSFDRDFSGKYICLTGYDHIIQRFKNRILPGLTKSVILILIESDVIKILPDILDHPKIKKVFQWNKEISHDKVKCLPIGINKDRHLESLMKIEPLQDKPNLIMSNFNPDTHSSRRDLANNKKLMDLCQEIPYHGPKKEYWNRSFTDGRIKISVTDEKFYQEMNKFKFVLSPRGAGLDCHRTWEALYLGCIPIVLSSSIDEIYQDLPVLVVQNWSELSEELLEKIWEEYKEKEWNMEKLRLDYWFGEFEKYYMDDRKNIRFITYGDDKFKVAKDRILRQAKNFGEFTSVRGYGPEDLDSEFREEFKDVLTQGRGGGYWVWRYHLINNIFRKMREGEILVYLDAGCHFNNKGKDRFHQYIDLLEKSEYGMLSFQMNDQIEKWWTVKEIFEHFGIDREGDVGNSGQYLGGIIFIKKCQHSVDYISKMLKILKKDRKLFTDHYNGNNQASYFKDNRHEQSVSSILRKIMGSEVIPRDETWHPQPFGCRKSLKYPIWAKRTKD